jgi:hypothetical protein
VVKVELDPDRAFPDMHPNDQVWKQGAR